MRSIAKAASRLGVTRLTWVRKAALAVLARFGQHDATIAHHWVPGRRIRLHRFRHKGYWFYGREREEDVMRAFALLVRQGDTVVELGAHIGYISVYLASLVGNDGHVYVFEPSPENLPYTTANTGNDPTITLVEQAASDKSGVATFYLEGLTGQNSTLVKDYALFDENRERAFSNESYRAIEVATTTLDSFVTANELRPAFIKIDVEGAELACLRGSVATLKRFRPRLMVEVTMERDAVFALMTDLGYRVYTPRFRPLATCERPCANLFFIHENDTAAAELLGL
jgi:FkbM family methyltransferase